MRRQTKPFVVEIRRRRNIKGAVVQTTTNAPSLLAKMWHALKPQPQSPAYA
jgi:hypothetical protein